MFKKILLTVFICGLFCFNLKASDKIRLLYQTSKAQENILGYRIRVIEIDGKKFIIVEKDEKVFYQGKNAAVSVSISIAPYDR